MACSFGFPDVLTLSRSCLAFTFASVFLFKLSQSVGLSTAIVHNTIVLWLITPLGVFSIAPYTESLHAAISFGALWAFAESSEYLGSMLVGIASACRSNAIVCV